MKKIVMLCAVLILMGCGSVYDEGIKEAYKVCENHGGVSYISPNKILSNSCEVTCKDKVIIDINYINVD